MTDFYNHFCAERTICEPKTTVFQPKTTVFDLKTTIFDLKMTICKILNIMFRLIWYVTTTLKWRHCDVIRFHSIAKIRQKWACSNRRPDISELVEEIICPRECDHMCIESNYGPVCACREGFRLYDDLRTCVLTEGKLYNDVACKMHIFTKWPLSIYWVDA